MDAPLFNKLNEYRKKEIYPFHMPGHKMGAGIEIEDVFSLDITEIDGFDNLHSAEGVIKEAQSLCAKTFGAKESFFLINGSSCGVTGSILALCSEKTVIAARNCHKSTFDGFILSGAKPVYIMPEIVDGYNVFGAVSLLEVEKACRENPEAAAVIIVSPTYEGVVSDIKAISKVVHMFNMVLIVDEAHGAHFNFNSYFPQSAVGLGADIVIQSLHKTLPSPTQTALLHVCSHRINTEKLKKCLAMVQSSSPSYLFMGIMDKCRAYLDNEGKKDFEEYSVKVKELRKSLGSLKNLKLMGEEIIGKNNVYDYDKGKIVLFSKGIDCMKIGEVLREKSKIELEMSCPTHFIAMTSVCDTKEGFERFVQAVIEIDNEISGYKKEEVLFIYPKPQTAFSPREAFNRETEQIKTITAKERVCGEFVIPYPPGIPLVSPGEIISEEVLNIIEVLKRYNVNIIGAENSSLENIKVLK